MTKRKSKDNKNVSGFYYWAIYTLLISLRVFFAIAPSPGYIFPDAYFQSVELGVHDIYTNSCNLLTWEFKTTGHGPVRSRTSIYPFVHIPMLIAQKLNHVIPGTRLSGEDLVNRILVPVRLFTTLLSFIPDLFVCYISNKLENSRDSKVPVALLLYSSMAYGGLLFNTHTLSNIWETVLVCIFSYLSMHSSLRNIMLEAAIGAYAIFLRPTFPVFVVPFILQQLYNILRSPRRMDYITFILPLGVISSCIFGAFLIFSDTIYYTGNQMPKLDEVIITPPRFIKYNSDPTTLSEHGLHPWYHYIVIHWPLILTPVLFLLVFIPPIRRGYNDGLRYTVWLSVILPTLFLTICPHKETRFLLPALPFAACLASLRVKRLKSLLVFWILYQAALVLFWGYLHQAGILPFLQSLPANDAHEVSLNIFYKTYMPPRFAFGEPQGPVTSIPVECLRMAPFHDTDTDTGCDRVLDFAGRPQSELFDFLDCLKTYSLPNTIIRIILPGSVLPLRKNLYDYGEILRIDFFFPHLSTENFPSFTISACPENMGYIDCLSAYWEILRNQLSLHSYEIDIS